MRHWAYRKGAHYVCSVIRGLRLFPVAECSVRAEEHDAVHSVKHGKPAGGRTHRRRIPQLPHGAVLDVVEPVGSRSGAVRAEDVQSVPLGIEYDGGGAPSTHHILKMRRHVDGRLPRHHRVKSFVAHKPEAHAVPAPGMAAHDSYMFAHGRKRLRDFARHAPERTLCSDDEHGIRNGGKRRDCLALMPRKRNVAGHGPRNIRVVAAIVEISQIPDAACVPHRTVRHDHPVTIPCASGERTWHGPLGRANVKGLMRIQKNAAVRHDDLLRNV